MGLPLVVEPRESPTVLTSREIFAMPLHAEAQLPEGESHLPDPLFRKNLQPMGVVYPDICSGLRS